MVKLAGVFGKISPFRALVLGDFLLDTYTTGRVKRVSPEAPVPILEVVKHEMRAGGAGNVVLNLLALGAEVYAAGRVGGDGEGAALLHALRHPSLRLDALVEEPGYQTPVKNRLIAESQQLLRVDREEIASLKEATERRVLALLEPLVSQVDVVAISDYGKGFLSKSLLKAVLALAKRENVPVIVDPKGLDFEKYSGATVLKPNLSEAYLAAKLPREAPLEEAARRLLESAEVEHLLITRSEAGISLFHRKGEQADFPVRLQREVKDVTGAGDTVLAMMALALAHRLDLSVGAEMANIAAGLAVERLGCVQITLGQLAERLLEIDCDTKVFEATQVYALQKALEGKKVCLLGLETQQALSAPFFGALQTLGAKKGSRLIVYVPDAEPEDHFIHLLSSLPEIDWIVLHRTGLQELSEAIQPDELYLFKDGMLSSGKEGKALLEELLTIDLFRN